MELGRKLQELIKEVQKYVDEQAKAHKKVWTCGIRACVCCCHLNWLRSSLQLQRCHTGPLFSLFRHKVKVKSLWFPLDFSPLSRLVFGRGKGNSWYHRERTWRELFREALFYTSLSLRPPRWNAHHSLIFHAWSDGVHYSWKWVAPCVTKRPSWLLFFTSPQSPFLPTLCSFSKSHRRSVNYRNKHPFGEKGSKLQRWFCSAAMFTL